MLQSVALVLGAYLVGSFASAILVCRAMGLPDPREGGSGNPGATNVLRLGGKKAAALTLTGDVLKGVLPVLVATWLDESPPVRMAVGFAAFLGHLFPVFFGFRGGKGVATAFGALVALSGSVGLAAVATWVGVAAATRYSSLAALTASVLAPAYAAFLTGETAYVVGLALIAVLLLVRHRGNIGRLLAGTESRIGEKAKAAPGA
ncbi:MAG: glycerol-3-phosphate 1-O-acyltransferase PlsY [Ectothiorhodospiraceae bacterium]|nr:glycerol-3-phosphate 1-O-acyltransferase PlsY [Chromatiales bacterium]MCP5157353.1 glycerol-3-phosphate 1-O-acyltransferase PlsY [Ectothiorhodospiraceae bacterium]